VTERQVLIDKDPQAGSNQLDALNEQELVAKANEALNKMAGQVSHGPSDPKALGVMRLRNGGIVYELNIPQTAIGCAKRRSASRPAFSGMSVVKEEVSSSADRICTHLA